MRNKNLFFILLGMLFACANIHAKTFQKTLVNLRTNYEVNPLGIEETPQFSWEMSAPESYNAQQKAYRIVVAESKKNLEQNNYVFDTGKKESSLSVSIPYAGAKLKPCTRYYWKVMVWDEKNKIISSTSDSWFETALMSQKGFGNAQWIGSHFSNLSKYTGKAYIDYDFTFKKGSNVSSFLLGYRSPDDYVKVTIDASDSRKPLLILYYKHDGVGKDALKQDISDIIPSKNINDKHHVFINMLACQPFNGYILDIKIDGNEVKNGAFAPKKGKVKEIFIQKAYTGYKYSRLYNIGFMQEKNQDVVYENITICEPFYKNVMYSDNKTYDIKGNGEAVILKLNDDIAAPMMRKSFNISKQVEKARLYATARGIYEMSLNGKNVSNDFFNPGWPDYRFRHTYNTFDVTSLLKEGTNVIGGILGNGYYSGSWGYKPNWANGYGTDISLMAKLVIDYKDGTQDVVVTDGSWVYTTEGPVLENDLQNGEDYDARREIQGWNTTQYDASKWKKVKLFSPLADSIKLQAYIGQPVRIDEICTAKKMKEPVKGHFIYDMGQNMVGVPRLNIQGKSGQRIQVRYAEMLYPDIIPTDPVAPYTIEMYKQLQGQMYTDNYRGALSADSYICKGVAGGETIEPHFTSHGFRYIEITGVDKAPALEDVKVLVLNSLQEYTASYKTDNEDINRLYNNVVWGQKGNFLAVPTDCPQRDERMGWAGDAQIFTRTATYNRNVQPFYNRWLYTLRDDQTPQGGYSHVAPLCITNPAVNTSSGWADVGIITPWEVYLQYGDKAILEKGYSSMQRYIEYLNKRATNYIQPIGGYGDWVALLGTPSDLTNTSYTALDVKIMSKIATILGKTEDAKYYTDLFGKIKDAFKKRYVRDDSYLIKPIGSPANKDSYSAAFGLGPKTEKDTILDTQTGYILPLYAGLLDGKIKEKAAAQLVNLLKQNGYRLNTGFIGTPYMNIVLSESGYDDVAYKMFLQNEYPSWLYPVYQGATTIWERWNSYTLVNGFGPVSMNSFNHYAYGAIQDWMMAYSAGIQRDEKNPGYKHILLQPRIGSTIGEISAKFNSVYGEINSEWRSLKTNKNDDSSQFGYEYNALVPANTTATLVLPLNGKKKVEVLCGKKGIVSKKQQQDKMVYELNSGKYVFKVM